MADMMKRDSDEESLIPEGMRLPDNFDAAPDAPTNGNGHLNGNGASSADAPTSNGNGRARSVTIKGERIMRPLAKGPQRPGQEPGSNGHTPSSLTPPPEEQSAPAPGNQAATDDEVEMHGTALPHRYYRRRLRSTATSTITQITTPIIPSDDLKGDISLARRVRQVIFGKPIPSAEFEKEHIGVFKALAVLSSDALSSVAYGTEASLAVLVTAGTAAATHNLFIGLSVVLLLSIVAFSYRQTIFTYPKGGGSYIVAKDNLNVNFGLIAASALMIDYVLTVSVSVSAGVLALVSPFPILSPYKVLIGVILILLLIFVNLRGVSESGSIFAAPTYLFVGSFLFMILIGVVRALFTGGLLHALPPGPSNIAATGHLSAFLVLTAFSSGCSAMTGTEAISDGVPIFKKPQSHNAAKTLLIMATILGTMYAGTTYLAWRYGISPQVNSEPTLTSQMATLFFSGWFGWFYYVFQFATTLILVLAANTSFADFPRLSMFLARDEYLPHFFSMQGDRLVYSTGIFVLGALSITLLVVFNGNTDALINLYALGVFVAFTMSQSGMVRHWWRARQRGEEGWLHKLAINSLGVATTSIVTAIIAVSKFDRGAWVVVILIPLMFMTFRGIHAHYQRSKKAITAVPVRKYSIARPHIVVVPIAKLDNLALRGLMYARSLSRYVVALHVSLSETDTEAIREQWEELVRKEAFLRSSDPLDDFGDSMLDMHSEITDDLVGPLSGPKLVVVDSWYREVTRPIITFIDQLKKAHPDDMITVVLPEFVPRHFWEPLLHNQTVLWLKLRLLNRPQIVTASVPYRLGDRDGGDAPSMTTAPTETPTPIA